MWEEPDSSRKQCDELRVRAVPVSDISPDTDNSRSRDTCELDVNKLFKPIKSISVVDSHEHEL